MIEQHYFTRERRGIFRSSEGYDSIAKSKGLDDGSIKKYLQPFCFYNTPRSLERAADKSMLKFPELYMLFQVETGDLVLCKTVYKDADFTGLRSTYFSHDIVIPATEKKEYIRDINKAIFCSDFVENYDIEKGMGIPELYLLSHEEWDAPEYMWYTLEKIGITKEVYKKLIYSAIASAMGKKNIYINLPVNISDISKYAKTVLKYVLNGLPFEVREKTGYATYLRDPESRRYMNIMFVEDEGMKTGYSKIGREYIFDIANERITNVDINTGSHPYLDYVYENIANLERLNPFYEFASSILNNAGIDVKFKPETYDDLCLLFRFNDGNIDIYRVNREMLYAAALRYYNFADETGRNILNGIYAKMIDTEMADIRSNTNLPSLDIIKSAAEYFKIGVLEVNKKIVMLCLIALCFSNKNNYLTEVFSSASVNKTMFSQLISMMLKNEQAKPALRGYWQNHFSKIGSFKMLWQEIDYWMDINDSVLTDQYFRNLIKDFIMNLLEISGNKITDGNKIHSYLSNITLRINDSGDRAEFTKFASSLINEIDDIIYESIDLNKITIEDLQSYNLRVKRKGSKYIALEFLRELINGVYDSKDCNMSYPFDLYDTEYHDMGKIIRRLYKGRIESKNYSKIVLGFISYSKIPQYDFKAMLEYVAEDDSNEIYDFVLWIFNRNIFSGSKEYIDTVWNYFRYIDSDALKNKKIKEKLYTNRELKVLLKEVRLDMSSPAVKFVRINIDRILIIICAAILTVVLIFAANRLLFGRNKDVSVNPIPRANGDTGNAKSIAEMDTTSEDQRLKKEIEKSIQNIKDELKDTDYKILCVVRKDSVAIAMCSINENTSFDNPFIEEHNKYQIIYSISIDKKDNSKVRDEDIKKMRDDLSKAIKKGTQNFIDNISSATP